VNGKRIKFTGKVLLLGPMVGYMMDIMKEGKKKVSGFIFGPRGRFLREIGKMGSSMDLGC
jgi:hypothetical protein